MLITRDWYLEVNAVPLACPAFEVPDIDALLSDPALRGLGGLVMPGAEGRRAYAPIIDATTVGPIPLDLDGNKDQDGVPIVDGREGLMEHREFLRNNLGFGKTTDRGLVDVVLHRGSMSPLTGLGQFLGLKGWVTQGIGAARSARTTFDLWLPDGELVETGS